MKKNCLILSSLLLFASQVFSANVTGVVFLDSNRNGKLDHGEKRLRGVLISNGDTIVVTDKHGRYQLPATPGSSVMPILPADYTLTGSKVVNSNFSYLGESQAIDTTVDFPMQRKKTNNRFLLNAIGDVQVGNYQELDYATRTLWPELLNSSGATVNLFLGDLVNNNLSLYQDLHALMEQLPAPTWTVLGNHDRDVDSVRWRQYRSYGEVFGSDMYAFNEGKVHFIILNNVYGKGPRAYEGFFSERQLNFVRQDLKHVPQDRLIVLSMHIPFAFTKNRHDLLDLLKGRGHVLAITGHLHQVGRFFQQGDGVTVHELGAGASCGFWWVGEKDSDGIPAALQQEGTPRNYFVVEFSNTSYQFRCKAIGQDARRQMTIHVTGIDTLDTHLRDLKHIPPATLMLTIYGGCDSTQVRCRIDNGEWMPCSKNRLVDPNVARTREQNLQKIFPTPFNKMNPLRNRESHQLWTLEMPLHCRRGAHVVEVEASDSYGFHATGTRSFCFEQKTERAL
ncbi:MAG: calcineurin-like phosphoesterase C-terminal domain-containing protein [Prevotella sp.]|nr:calcineurin-like phosphoesterase C-terminal domain-containing protein [Prevotella sp.]